MATPICLRSTTTAPQSVLSRCFFFAAPAATATYTLSLHDALPISAEAEQPVGPRRRSGGERGDEGPVTDLVADGRGAGCEDRKSTRLNSSHLGISYAVFCLQKKRHRGSTSRSNGARGARQRVRATG